MGDYIKNPDLQHVLGSLWGYYGLPPSKLSGFYYANATGGYLKNGSYYIKQRSQDLSDAHGVLLQGKWAYPQLADSSPVSVDSPLYPSSEE